MNTGLFIRESLIYHRIKTIREAAEKAASLTRQLLVFSKRQAMEPEIVSLNQVVMNMEKLFKRIIGEDIEFKVGLDPGLWLVEADPSQIEQVVMNLAVNARDAMPQGGTFTIETANVVLREEGLRGYLGMEPGEYVLLTVKDTGHGMDEKTRARIFDPFFSTKEGGTGLGLATVYGIVEQWGWGIRCHSEPGRGTTFEIYIPRYLGERRGENRPSPEEKEVPSMDKKIRVLLVEDESAVREITATILKKAGYHVLEAGNGEEALGVLKKTRGNLDLLITDVVMPRMSGGGLAKKVMKVNPGVKVLYMSGYTGKTMLRHGVSDETHLIQKPFAGEELLEKARHLLRSTP